MRVSVRKERGATVCKVVEGRDGACCSTATKRKGLSAVATILAVEKEGCCPGSIVAPKVLEEGEKKRREGEAVEGIQYSISARTEKWSEEK